MVFRFNIISLVLFISLGGLSGISAQTPRFTKFDVMKTGAAAYFPAEPEFEMTLSEDKSEVYTAEVKVGDFTYGSIIVKFKEPLGDDTDDWDSLVISYMRFLNEGVFELESETAPGFGHTLDSNPSARGVLQYGEDEDGIQYTIKGWVDGQFMAVMYVSYMEEMNINFQNLFLDGFRFPNK